MPRCKDVNEVWVSRVCFVWCVCCVCSVMLKCVLCVLWRGVCGVCGVVCFVLCCVVCVTRKKFYETSEAEGICCSSTSVTTELCGRMIICVLLPIAARSYKL